jgi:hypothetical protein
MNTLGDRARKAEGLRAEFTKSFGVKLPKVRRREMGHLDRSEILGGCFGCRPRKIPEPKEGKSPFWWRKQPLSALGNPAFGSAVVGDLSLAELEAIVGQ